MDKIFYVLFGTAVAKNNLFVAVVAPSEVEFDRTTKVDMWNTVFQVDCKKPLENSLFLLMELQCMSEGASRSVSCSNVQGQGPGWACVEIEYPTGGEVSALKMKDTVRGFATSILKNHGLVNKEESEEEEYGFDDI